MNSIKSLGVRLGSYANQLTHTEKLYARAVEAARTLSASPQGDLCQEAERLRHGLRSYDLALCNCLAYAESLTVDMDHDLRFLNELSANDVIVNGRNSAVTLETQLATVQTIIALCTDHRRVVNKTKRSLKTARTTWELVQLAETAKTLRERYPIR